MKIDEAALKEITAKPGYRVSGMCGSKAAGIAPAAAVIGHKFKAVPTVNDGIRFDSKLEGQYYQHLKLLQKTTGEVLTFLRQVPFHLPGGTKYTVDFQVFYADGRVEFVDVKGMETKEFIRAKKQVEDLYKPIVIRVVKKGVF